MTTDFPYVDQLTGRGGIVCVSETSDSQRTPAAVPHQIVCVYLIILQAALCFHDEFNVLAGESHQLTVTGSQGDILKEMQRYRVVNRMSS